MRLRSLLFVVALTTCAPTGAAAGPLLVAVTPGSWTFQITDGTSNTILFGENTRYTLCLPRTISGGFSDGTSNVRKQRAWTKWTSMIYPLVSENFSKHRIRGVGVSELSDVYFRSVYKKFMNSSNYRIKLKSRKVRRKTCELRFQITIRERLYRKKYDR